MHQLQQQRLLQINSRGGWRICKPSVGAPC
jgi:hypothetical protein